MLLRTVIRRAMIVLAVACCLSVSSACAEEAKKVINAMAVTTYPPFEFADTSGKSVGLAIDILDGIALKLGAEVNWVQSSFDQIISFAPLKTARRCPSRCNG